MITNAHLGVKWGAACHESSHNHGLDNSIARPYTQPLMRTWKQTTGFFDLRHRKRKIASIFDPLVTFSPEEPLGSSFFFVHRSPPPVLKETR
jgi:hypothetical protein